MGKTFKKILCTLLVVVMCLTSAPLQGFVGMDWPRLPEINLGEFKLPEIDFSLWFGSEVSATGSLATTGQCGESVYWNYNSTTGELVIGGSGLMTNFETGKSPFEYADIKSVVIEKGVTAIGNHSFVGCKNLRSVMISEGVVTIGQYAFDRCENLTYVDLPDSLLQIQEYAFYDCKNLESIDIPHNVKSIRRSAFGSCENLSSITIPSSVGELGSGVFSFCYALKSISVATNNKRFSSDSRGVIFDKNKTILIQYPLGNINNNYIIPNSVTTIYEYAFSYSKALTNITIPDSVKTINDSAFRECINLKSVTIPKSVTSMGYHVFENCRNLENVIFLGNTDEIRYRTFNACYNLKSITITDIVKTIGQEAFYNCYNLENVYYTGTEKQWKSIKIHDKGNECLTKANIHYNFGDSIEGVITAWDRLDNIVHIDNVAYSVKNDLRLEVDIFDCKYRKVRCKLESGIVVSCEPISEGTEIVFGNGYKYHIYTGETSLHYKEDGENGFSITGLDAKLFSDTLTGEDVTWSCSDESKLKIVKYSGILYNNEKGYYYLNISVKALKSGTVTLTATAKDGTSASCEVMVKGTDSYLSVYSDTSTSASVDEELCLYVASFKNGKQTWQERDLNIVFDNPEIFEVSSTGFYSEYGKEEVYFELYLKAKKVGTTTLTISDPETKAFIDVPLTATEKMNVMRFDDVTSKEYEKGRKTNFYNCNGLYVENFKYNESTGYVTMDVFNTKHINGVVVAYDSNGQVFDFDIIVPYINNTTKVWDTVVQGWEAIKDIKGIFGDKYFYSGKSISTESNISVKVPKDGCLVITNNCTFNEVAYLVNMIDFIVNITFASVSYYINTQEMDELILEISEKTIKEVIESVGIDVIKSFAESLTKNISYANINKNISEFSNAIKDLGFDIIKVITDVINLKFGWSLAVSTIYNWLPTSQAMNFIFSTGQAANIIEQIFQFIKTDSPQIVLYPPLEKGDPYISDGVVVNPEKDLPDGCVLHTYVISDEHKIASEIKPVLDTKASKYKIHNITLYKNGKEIQPNGKIKVMIPIPEGYNHNNIKIYWYKDDGTLIEMNAKVEGGYAVFETDHLSNYVICDARSQAVVVESGTCGAYGDNVKWELDRNGVLRIYGTGMMDEFILKDSPWYNDRNSFYIQSVIVEQGVTTIGPGAFKNLKNLKNVYISNTVVDIGNSAFSGCSYKLKEIFIPANVKTIGVYAFDGCTALSSVVIEDGVETIDDCAFRYCDIEYINIPKSVVYIGDDAFAGNYSLKGVFVDSRNANYVSDIYGVLFDKNITTLMIYPLQSTLTSYIIPNTVISIERLAFFWANNLKNVTISNSVKEIKESAFARMENLKEVTLYNSVENIGSNVFNGCENLSDIYFYGTSNEWKNITISKDNEELHNANIHYMTHTHVYKQDKILPTCTEQGNIKYSCSCGYSYTESIPTTSHSYKEGDSRCTICGYDKTNDCNCNCHKGGIKSFFFKLILFFQKIFKTNKVCKCGKYHY